MYMYYDYLSHTEYTMCVLYSQLNNTVKTVYVWPRPQVRPSYPTPGHQDLGIVSLPLASACMEFDASDIMSV